MQKVWNITDGSRFKGSARVLMIMGKTVDPGRYVSVPDERVGKAHKLAADATLGAVYIGNELPEWYKKEKTPKHVPFPIGHNRAHGAKLESSPTLKEEVAAKVEEVVNQATNGDSSETGESDEGLFGRKRRHRG